MDDADVMARARRNGCAKSNTGQSLISPVSRYGLVLWLAHPPRETEVESAASALESSAEDFLARVAHNIEEYLSKELESECTLEPRTGDELVRKDKWQGRTPILHFRAHDIICSDFRASHRIVVGVCTPSEDRGTTNHSKIWSRISFCGSISSFGWARFASLAYGLNRNVVKGVVADQYREVIRRYAPQAAFAVRKDYEVMIDAANSFDIEIAQLLRSLNLGHLTSIGAISKHPVWVSRLHELFRELGYAPQARNSLELKLSKPLGAVRKAGWLRVPGPETDALYHEIVTDERTRLVGIATSRDFPGEADSPANPAYVSSGILEGKFGGFL